MAKVTSFLHSSFWSLLLTFVTVYGQRMELWDPVYTLPPDNTTTCSICDHLGLPVKTDEIVNVRGFNETCLDLNNFYLEGNDRLACSFQFSFLAKKCCDFSGQSFNTYECEENVRKEILTNDMHKSIPPFPGFGNQMIIETNLVHEMLHDLNVKESTVSIYVSLELKWHDPRLAWNISSSKCVSKMMVRASTSLEETEIWVPYYDLVNKLSGAQDFSLYKAFVTHDGTVTWIRSGALTAFCSFNGVERIPFDTVGCQFFFDTGVPDYDVKVVTRNGVSVGPFKQKYKEFHLAEDKIKVEKASEDTTHIYSFFYERTSRFYLLKIILPTLFFTYISFGLFLMHIDSGERIGFGVSVLLVIIAQEIITNDYIPLGTEVLWLTTFIQGSTYFTFLALAQTILVNWIYYLSVRMTDMSYMPKQMSKYSLTKFSGTKAKEQTLNEVVVGENDSSSRLSSHKEKDNSLEQQRAISFDEKNNQYTIENFNDHDGPSYYSCDNDSVSSKNSSVQGRMVEDGEKFVFELNDEASSLQNKKDTNLVTFSSSDKVSGPPKVSPAKDRRDDLRSSKSHTRRQSTSSEGIRNSLRNLFPKSPVREIIVSHKDDIVKKFDHVCLIIFPLAYSIFVIVMFTTNKTNDSKNESWFFGEPIE